MSSSLEQLLKQHLGAEIVSCQFDRKAYPRRPDAGPDAGPDASWRDDLLRTFKIRLALAEEHNADASVISETRSFVSTLEALDRTADLYSWQDRTVMGHYTGWATAERVVHITRSRNDET